MHGRGCSGSGSFPWQDQTLGHATWFELTEDGTANVHNMLKKICDFHYIVNILYWTKYVFFGIILNSRLTVPVTFYASIRE